MNRATDTGLPNGSRNARKAYWTSRKARFIPRFTNWKTKGSVESYEGVERGRPRRHYRITNSGRAALAKDRVEWRDLSWAVTMILGEA